MADTNDNSYVITGKYADAIIADVRLWIEIEDQGVARNFGAVQFGTTFAINQIPKAYVVVATGQLVAFSGAEKVEYVSPLFWSELLEQNKHVVVKGRFTGAYNAKGAMWPDEDIVLFDGSITGMGSTNEWNTRGIVLELTHWLNDLNVTAMLHARLSPVCGGQLLQPMSNMLNPTGVPGSFTAGYLGEARPPRSYLNNLWIGGLKPFFRSVAKHNYMLDAQACPSADLQEIIRLSAPDNVRLYARLADSTAEGHYVFDNPYYITVGKLHMRLDHALMENKIVSTVELDVMSHATGYTCWGKLLLMAQLFQFTVIPTVSSATCAPFMEQLDKGRHYAEIAPEEYGSVSLNAELPYPMYGVIMRGPMHDVTNAAGLHTTSPWLSFFINPKYKAAPGGSPGVIDLIDSPPWLLPELNLFNIKSPEVWHKIKTLAENANGHAPTVSNTELSKIADDSKSIGDRYCEAEYWRRQFSYRTGKMIGKFRLDIAPGSLVKVGFAGLFDDKGEEKGEFYAAVVGVTLNIDANSRVAQTSFDLVNVRSMAEKDQGPPGHPLYDSEWLGTWLQTVPGITGGGVVPVGAPENLEILQNTAIV